MPKKTVEIILGPTGTVKVEANGFKGGSCEEATKFLNELFGEATSKELKDEYYQEEVISDGLPSGYCG